jgi:hypothetical protein
VPPILCGQLFIFSLQSLVMDIKVFRFQAELWLWDAIKGSWHFVSVPLNISRNIKNGYPFHHGKFGTIPVIARIGKTEWETSAFFDSKSKGYILPVKSMVRDGEELHAGDEVKVELEVSF